MKLMEASRHFKVPKLTLYTLAYVKDDSPDMLVIKKLGRPPIFPSDLEKELVRYLILMESNFYGLTRNDIRRTAYQVVERNGIVHSVMKRRVELGSIIFMNRYKNLFIRKPTGTSYARTRIFNRQNIENFLDILKVQYKKYKYPPDRISNMDVGTERSIK